MDESRASQRDDPRYTPPGDPVFGPLGAQEVQRVEKKLAWPILFVMIAAFVAVWAVGSSPKLRAIFVGDENVVTEQRPSQATDSLTADSPAATRTPTAAQNSGPSITNSAFIDASQYGENCEAMTRKPSRDPRWKQDLSLSVPQEVLGATIPVYQIQWFSGQWSKPFTPGDGDIDWKDNGPGKKRRVWSYFFDHNHRFVACGADGDSTVNETAFARDNR